MLIFLGTEEITWFSKVYEPRSRNGLHDYTQHLVVPIDYSFIVFAYFIDLSNADDELNSYAEIHALLKPSIFSHSFQSFVSTFF